MTFSKKQFVGELCILSKMIAIFKIAVVYILKIAWTSILKKATLTFDSFFFISFDQSNMESIIRCKLSLSKNCIHIWKIDKMLFQMVPLTSLCDNLDLKQCGVFSFFITVYQRFNNLSYQHSYKVICENVFAISDSFWKKFHTVHLRHVHCLKH